MGKLSDRGEILAQGGAALAGADGDDTLTPITDRPDARGVSPDVEGEKDPEATPGPADIPAPPVVETADDQDAGTRENR